MTFNHLVTQYIRPMRPIPTSLEPSGMLTEKIKCIIFDVYGTLFISGSGDVGTARKNKMTRLRLEKLIRRYHIDKHPDQVLSDFFHQIEIVHQALCKKGIDFPEVTIEKIWQTVLGLDAQSARKFSVEYEWIQNPVYPMPCLKQMLNNCRKSNTMMGILSNAQFFTPYLFDWLLKSNLGDLGFEPDITLFSFQFGRAKPSPYLFQLAVNRLKKKDISAHDVLYVGNDMLNDIYPAQRVGFKTALFAGDARSLRLREDHFRCKNLSPDLIITRLDQLLIQILT